MKDTNGYADMKNAFDFAAFAGSEYDLLVFPLAQTLGVSYLYPIDDLSSWKEYEKYFEALQVVDSTQASELVFDSERNALRKTVDQLPPDSSKWLFSNSAAIQKQLLMVEGYKIPNDASPQMKGLNHYWMLRNEKMATHIYDVAREHPREKIAVFFGASHVGAVRTELKRINKRIHVVTLADLIDQ